MFTIRSSHDLSILDLSIRDPLNTITLHIWSKFNGGKQVDRSQSGSWEGCCAGAALRVNERPEWRPICWKKKSQILQSHFQMCHCSAL